MQDEASVKLINLYHYESRRSAPAAWATRLANVAAAAADEQAIRVAARSDGSLAVAQVEFDRAEVQASTSDAAALRFLGAFMRAEEGPLLAQLRASALSLLSYAAAFLSW